MPQNACRRAVSDCPHTQVASVARCYVFLKQNFPSTFADGIVIFFGIADEKDVVASRRVRLLYDERAAPGKCRGFAISQCFFAEECLRRRNAVCRQDAVGEHLVVARVHCCPSVEHGYARSLEIQRYFFSVAAHYHEIGQLRFRSADEKTT